MTARAYDVACPTCGAHAGQRCLSARSTTGLTLRPHGKRRNAKRQADRAAARRSLSLSQVRVYIPRSAAGDVGLLGTADRAASGVWVIAPGRKLTWLAGTPPQFEALAERFETIATKEKATQDSRRRVDAIAAAMRIRAALAHCGWTV